jgi:Aminotransferase class I and II
MIELAKKLSWAIATKENKNFFNARPQAKLLLQGSRAVNDPVVNQHLENILSQDLLNNGLRSPTVLKEFKTEFTKWVNNHSSSTVSGLEAFNPSFSAGTTQAFDSFYYRHRTKHMKCFLGEYFYHLKTWLSNDTSWSFVSGVSDLVRGDALVISVPFCDTGNAISNLEEILTHCDSNNIPVLVDCCYYPISSGIDLNLNHPSIDTVAFSLSKAFPIANLRIGVRYTKPGIEDGQTLHDTINYNNSLSSYIGLSLIQKFSADYIYKTYRSHQHQVCEKLNLTPSQTVLFAIGDGTWDTYSRANLLQTYKLDLDPSLFKNRISLVSIFNNWEIFNEIAT